MFKLNQSAQKVKVKITLLVALFLSVQPAFSQSAISQLFEGFHQFSDSYRVTDKEIINGNGIEKLTLNAIRQQGNRDFPYPTKGHTLIVNPPIFTWPMADYECAKTFSEMPMDKKLEEYLRYDFQLGRVRNLAGKETITATGLHMPFYNNHKALTPGT